MPRRIFSSVEAPRRPPIGLKNPVLPGLRGAMGTGARLTRASTRRPSRLTLLLLVPVVPLDSPDQQSADGVASRSVDRPGGIRDQGSPYLGNRKRQALPGCLLEYPLGGLPSIPCTHSPSSP